MDPKSFYNLLDTAVSGSAPKAAKKTTRVAKEELDSTSSQDEFIEAIAQAACSFIRANRQAFSLDDVEAVEEFAQVFTVAKVKEQVVQYMQTPDASPEEDEPVNEPSEEPLPEPTKNNDDSDLVSDDVMKLLDE